MKAGSTHLCSFEFASLMLQPSVGGRPQYFPTGVNSMVKLIQSAVTVLAADSETAVAVEKA